MIKNGKKADNFLPFLVKLKLFLQNKKISLDRRDSYSILYHTFSHKNLLFYTNTTTYEKFFQEVDLLQKCGFRFCNDFLDNAYKDPTIYITFDEGYKSNLEILRSLEKMKIPSTIFISTNLFHDPLLPKDKIRQTLRYIPKNREFTFLEEKYIFKNSSFIYREKLSIRLNRTALQKLSFKEYSLYCNNFLEENRAFSNYDEDLVLLNSDEMEELKKMKYLKIGSHGTDHYNYTLMNEAELNNDLFQSQKILHDFLDRDIDLIAYPYGSFNQQVTKAAKRHYKKALTTAINPLGNEVKRADECFEYPRLLVDNRKIVIGN